VNESRQSLIICVGNPWRRDDGAGPAIAQRLRAMKLPNVAIDELSGEGAALIEAWKDATDVIVIDAARSGGAPGTIHRFDATSARIPSGFFHYSTHAFSVAEAVELARALDQLPPRLILFGIEGCDFTAGKKISPEVSAAIDELAARIRNELQCVSGVPLS
jgi:hydrogenase maturation protease